MSDQDILTTGTGAAQGAAPADDNDELVPMGQPGAGYCHKCRGEGWLPLGPDGTETCPECGGDGDADERAYSVLVRVDATVVVYAADAEEAQERAATLIADALEARQDTQALDWSGEQGEKWEVAA